VYHIFPRQSGEPRSLEIMPVILSAAHRAERFFASLRMTARASLKSAHRKLFLQTSGASFQSFSKVAFSAKTGRLQRQKWKRKSVARRATLFLFFRGGVGNTYDDY